MARRAGVSKGGLMHHYKTKEALVEGIFTSTTQALHARIKAQYESQNRAPGSFTRAYIEATLRHAEEGYMAPLLALAASDPDIMGVLTELNAWCHERLENDGIDPVLAHVAASAADGLWVEIIFHLERADSWRVRAIRAALLEMTRTAKS